MRLIKILFALIVVLVIASVTLTNRTLDESLVVANLDKEISTLQNQNTILRAQVAVSGSLSALSPKIAQAGFVESSNTLSLSSVSSVALR